MIKKFCNFKCINDAAMVAFGVVIFVYLLGQGLALWGLI